MRKDSVTYIIAKSGIPEIMVDLLRTGISDRGKNDGKAGGAFKG